MMVSPGLCAKSSGRQANLIRTKRIGVPPTTKHEIWDQSKADKFAKGLASLQAGWLILGLTARASQSLSITPLEVFTAVFI